MHLFECAFGFVETSRRCFFSENESGSTLFSDGISFRLFWTIDDVVVVMVYGFAIPSAFEFFHTRHVANVLGSQETLPLQVQGRFALTDV